MSDVLTSFLNRNMKYRRNSYTTVTLLKPTGRPTVGEQKMGKIGRRRPMSAPILADFFWSADDFFVEAPKLKVSSTDPPIFMGFVIGEASGDGRPMIGRK